MSCFILGLHVTGMSCNLSDYLAMGLHMAGVSCYLGDYLAMGLPQLVCPATWVDGSACIVCHYTFRTNSEM